MGSGAGQLAGGLHPAAALGEVPADWPGGGIGRRNGPGEIAQHRLVELRPELQQGEGAVEPHIEALVPGVVEALEHPEASHRILRRGGGPEAAATGQVVELIEQGHAQGIRQVGALHHRLLPAVDGLPPAAPVRQGFGCDGGGVVAAAAEDVGVAAQGAGAGGEARHRQVPADHHRQLQALARFEPEAHRQGGAGVVVVGAAAVVVALGDRALTAEGVPELAAIASWIPAAAAHDLQARMSQGGLIGHRQAPLALALGQGLGLLPFQQHALQARCIQLAVALSPAAADRRHVVVFGAAVVTEVHGGGRVGVGEPADRVAPAQQQREIKRGGGGVAEAPAEHRHRVAGALVITGKNWAEGLTAHLRRKDVRVVEGAAGVAGAVGAAALFGGAGGVPAPGRQGRLGGIRSGVVPQGGGGQGMGLDPLAVVLEQGELAVGQGAEPVLTAIEVPKIEGAIRAAADAAGAEPPQGCPVIGPVVEVAGVAHRVGPLPAEAEGPLPGGWRGA